MIFRRSLVRELTATADRRCSSSCSAILFTNLVLRLLARAAGGAVAPDGIARAARLQRAVLSQHPAVGRAVPDGAADAVALVPRQRDDRLVYRPGSRLAACLRPILLFAAPFLVAIVVLSLFLSPWAEQRKLEYERQLESRDEIALLTPGLFREFARANLVVFVESINTLDGTIRNVFLHSVDDEQGRDDGRARRGYLEVAANGDRFIVLDDGRRYEGKPGSRRIPRSSSSRSSGAASSPPSCARCRSRRKAIPTATLLVARRHRSSAPSCSGASRCRSRRWC